MHTLSKYVLVPFTTEQMFELVNKIEDYPQFLPWCEASKVITRDGQEVTAALEVAWKGIRKKFMTRNISLPFEKIDIKLVEGPLQHLEGVWNFYSLGEAGCKVTLDLEFKFSGGLVDRLFQPIFHHIANTLVDAFCQRATILYGKK